MKKTLLAVLVLPVMFVAGAANAAFVESQDGFTGKLDFNGTIVNKAPNWAWEIPDASVAKAKDWALELQQSNVVGKNNVWNLSHKGPLTALHGYMVTSSASGAPGLTPVIELNGIKLVGGLQEMAVKAMGTVGGKAVPDGSMKLQISSVLGTVMFFSGDNWQVKASDGAWTTTVDAITILQKDASAALNVKHKGVSWHDGGASWKNSEAYLMGAGYHDVTGQFVAEAGGFQLTFPTAGIPDTWTASLPIVVTMK